MTVAKRIQKELELATRVKRIKGGDEQDYLRKLVEAVYDLPVTAWEALSPEAQTWYDVAVGAVNAGNVIPSFVVAESVVSQGIPIPTQEQLQEKVESEQTETAVTKEAVPVPVTKIKSTPRHAGRNKVSARIAVIRAICEHPEWSVDQISVQLVTQEVVCSKSNIASIGHMTRLVLAVLEEMKTAKVAART